MFLFVFTYFFFSSAMKASHLHMVTLYFAAESLKDMNKWVNLWSGGDTFALQCDRLRHLAVTKAAQSSMFDEGLQSGFCTPSVLKTQHGLRNW